MNTLNCANTTLYFNSIVRKKYINLLLIGVAASWITRCLVHFFLECYVMTQNHLECQELTRKELDLVILGRIMSDIGDETLTNDRNGRQIS